MTEFLRWGLPGFLTRDVSVSGIGIVMVPELEIVKAPELRIVRVLSRIFKKFRIWYR